MERIICLVIGYVCGLFQTGYIIGKVHKTDIRDHGSGNAGTTNAFRTFGKKAGAITLLGDCLKCVLAIVIVRMVYGNSMNGILPFMQHWDVSSATIFRFLWNFAVERELLLL